MTTATITADYGETGEQATDEAPRVFAALVASLAHALDSGCQVFLEATITRDDGDTVVLRFNTTEAGETAETEVPE